MLHVKTSALKFPDGALTSAADLSRASCRDALHAIY